MNVFWDCMMGTAALANRPTFCVALGRQSWALCVMITTLAWIGVRLSHMGKVELKYDCR